MNSRIVTIVVIVVFLICAAFVIRDGNLLLLTMPFLAYLASGILRTPVIESVNITADRLLKKTSIDGSISIEVCVTINNRGETSVLLRVSDRIQPLMKIIDGELEQKMLLYPGEKGDFIYSFRAVRGNFIWENVHVKVIDPLGLIETELELPAGGEIHMNPLVKKFKPVSFRPNSTLHSPGSVPARLGGSGTDFWGVREYQQGDSLRWLDWRLTARHPHKFFTKEFEQEEIADIGFILDARQKTNIALDDENLFEYSVGAASSMAEMFLHQGHRVSMLICGEKILNIFPGFGKIQLNKILCSLAKTRVGKNHELENLSSVPVRLFPSRSLIIVISPLTSKDLSLFPVLRAHGYSVLLVSPDTIGFLYDTSQGDTEALLAVRAAKLERLLNLRSISRLGISVIDWNVKQPLFQLFRNALTKVRSQ